VNKISNGLGNMTEKEDCFQQDSFSIQRLQGFGDRRINAEAQHIVQLVEQLEKVISLDPAVKDAAIQRALHTTRTMTLLLTLLGSVSPATNKDIKS